MYIHAYTQTFSEIKERQNRETQGKRDRKEHREDTHTERERERGGWEKPLEIQKC